MRKTVVVIVLCAVVLGGCQTTEDMSGGKIEEKFAQANQAEGNSRSLGLFFALYLPNRIMDVFEIFRIGIGLGFTAGWDLRITRFAQLAAGVRTDVGLAWVGRRRTPLRAENNAYTAFGPWRAAAEEPQWPLTAWAFEFEVGAGGASIMTAIDFAEIVDMLTGWFGLDLLKDDWGYD